MENLLNLELRQECKKILFKYKNELKSLKIDHIGYREFHYDGTSSAFCSHDGWYKVTLDNRMSMEMSLHYAQELISLNRDKFHYIIRTPFCAKNAFLKELLKRDMCNSLLIYTREPKVIRMFAFISYTSNLTALNNFFNNKTSFDSFTNYYKNELINIFTKEKYKVLRKPLFPQELADSIFLSQDSGNIIINDCILTKREFEVAQLLLSGATDKDIAQRFDISPRTAYYHVTNLKKKLKVNSRINIQSLMKL
jgi:DNA-binding CsgD family transcriptional regulator